MKSKQLLIDSTYFFGWKGVSKPNVFESPSSKEVIPERFERSTHALEGRCSIQLSYGTNLLFFCVAKVILFFKLCNATSGKRFFI